MSKKIRDIGRFFTYCCPEEAKIVRTAECEACIPHGMSVKNYLISFYTTGCKILKRFEVGVCDLPGCP
jgi:hypothetical protein